MPKEEINIIEVPNAPAIPGLIFRGYRGAEDHAIMASLINAANQADGVPEAIGAEDVAHFLTNPRNMDAAKDVIVAEVNGMPACYGRVFWQDEAEDDHISARVYGSRCNTHPRWRRKGLGAPILAWMEARIRQIAAGHLVEIPKFFQVVIVEKQAGAAMLLKQFGYQPTRHFFQMSRSLAEELPMPALPRGLKLRPVEPGHMRLIWDAMEEAFLDHWGFSPRSDQDFQKWLKQPNTDVGLWKVAWDGDQVAGLSLNYVYSEEKEKLGFLQAWTEPICVRRPWRQRGLGRALLLASQHEMKGRGIQVASLEVDAQNPNQALHLYESCGYQIRVRRDLYRKALT